MYSHRPPTFQGTELRNNQICTKEQVWLVGEQGRARAIEKFILVSQLGACERPSNGVIAAVKPLVPL